MYFRMAISSKFRLVNSALSFLTVHLSPFLLQNEISQVFEPSTAKCSSKPSTKNHAPGQPQQNENHQSSNAPVAEWEAGQVLSDIVADLTEMITRFKLARSLNENHEANQRIEGISVNGSLANVNETNGIHIPEDVLIKELSASQSTLNSTVRQHFY